MISHRDIQAGLASVSPLDRARSRDGQHLCKLCGGRTRQFDFVDANKFCSNIDCYQFGMSGVGVVYLQCENCGFVFTTDFDNWSKVQFQQYIYNEDYIKIDPEYIRQRPLLLADSIANKLSGLTEVSILDYGSGTGAFVDEMRRKGFAIVDGYDPFSNPIRPRRTFQLITCMEVIEHTPNPVETLRDISKLLEFDGIAFIQTGIMPRNIDALRGRWWYIAPRNGHISIFGLLSIRTAAHNAGLDLKLGANNELLLWKQGHQPNREILRALGGKFIRDYVSMRLSAPGKDYVNADGPRCLTRESWHDLERSEDGIYFRWSATDTLIWELKAVGNPLYLEIEIDVVMAVAEAYIRDLKLEINGQEVALSDAGGGRLTTLAVLDRDCEIIRCTLRTLPPITPLSLGRNSDPRPLGVAIRVG